MKASRKPETVLARHHLALLFWEKGHRNMSQIARWIGLKNGSSARRHIEELCRCEVEA